MKVGGNESATKFFQSNGGTAALASKDAKVKYTSNAANKYKEELKRRAARDAEEYVVSIWVVLEYSHGNSYPEEVVITDEVAGTAGDGTSTPAADNADDDFFSSWDKPSIKRPSNPPSRVGTPPVISRTASPFLSAGAPNGANARPKSPLNVAATDAENNLPAPTAIRTTSASAIRRPGTTGAVGAKRTNILGAKKNQKLGAKKIVGDDIDFEAAEKAAKAEAERIEKLGYDPEAEKAAEAAKNKPSSIAAAKPEIASPTPATAAAASNNKPQRERSASEVERLGMGMGRLGFGQVGKPAGAGAGASVAPRKMGFGSVGIAKKTAQEGEHNSYSFIKAFGN